MAFVSYAYLQYFTHPKKYRTLDKWAIHIILCGKHLLQHKCLLCLLHPTYCRRDHNNGVVPDECVI